MITEHLKEHDIKLIQQLRENHGGIGIINANEIDRHAKITLQTALGLIISLIKNEGGMNALQTAGEALQRIIKALD